MGHRPKWRVPLGHGNPHPVQSLAFLASRRHTQLGNDDSPVPKCQAIARSTGQKCRHVALRGSTRCRVHSGLYAAARAEAESFGTPILVLRQPRKRALEKLGKGPAPEDFPWRSDFHDLGPLARGRLYEAFENRVMAPDVWRNERRLSPKRKKSVPK